MGATISSSVHVAMVAMVDNANGICKTFLKSFINGIIVVQTNPTFALNCPLFFVVLLSLCAVSLSVKGSLNGDPSAGHSRFGAVNVFIVRLGPKAGR